MKKLVSDLLILLAVIGVIVAVVAFCTGGLTLPVPPSPTPPADAFTAALQVAYTADAAAVDAKAAQKMALRALYSAMTLHVKSPSILTTKDLLDDYTHVARDLILPTALIEVRKAISVEVVIELGTDPATKMDAALRVKAEALFTRIAKALDAVK